MRLLSLRGLLRHRRARPHACGVPRDEPAPPRPAGGVPSPAGAAPAARAWPASRLSLAASLWGEGFALPGGAEELRRLATPLGLSPAASLLLVGTGPGGFARLLATEFGVWVAGFESDAVLAATAAESIRALGKAWVKRATVTGWRPQAPQFGRHTCHHAIAIEPLRNAAPEAVLPAIAAAVKPGGQIMLLDLVAPRRLDPADPAVAAWCRVERRSADLPTADGVTAGLTGLGFDVRVVEDLSSRHIRLAVIGWKRLLRVMREQKPDAVHAATIVAEAELWTRRLRLVHSGQVRLVRWHAIGRQGGARPA
jgi:cyclopropane fatty-acyl-phospholipid synthase-like methyltransferase